MSEQYQNSKPFSRLSWFFIGLIITGLGLIIAFRLAGTSVGPDGMLQEPFYLLGAGYILAIIGIAGLLTRITASLLR